MCSTPQPSNAPCYAFARLSHLEEPFQHILYKAPQQATVREFHTGLRATERKTRVCPARVRRAVVSLMSATLHIANTLGGTVSDQIVTINKLRFVSTRTEDVKRLVLTALEVSSTDANDLELITEDLQVPLRNGSTLMDAGLPNSARLVLRKRSAAVTHPAQGASPKLRATTVSAMSPDTARTASNADHAGEDARPSPSPPPVRRFTDTSFTDPVLAIDVVVQGARGRPVYRLKSKSGLGNKTIGELKQLAIRFTQIPAEHQRFFVNNKMRRDDEITALCLHADEAQGAAVPTVRMFRSTLTVTVVFPDGAELQVHELRDEDTLTTVREALATACGDLVDVYPWFDAATAQLHGIHAATGMAVAQRPPGAACLGDFRDAKDGGVIALVASPSTAGLPQQQQTPRKESKRHGSSVEPIPSPKTQRVQRAVSAAPLDTTSDLDVAAPQDVSVIVINEDIETVSIASPTARDADHRSDSDNDKEHRANAAAAREPRSEENRQQRTVVTRSSIALSSAVVQAELMERQRARMLRNTICEQHSRRRAAIEEAMKARTASLTAVTTCLTTSNSVPRQSLLSTAGRRATSERATLVSISPPRDRHQAIIAASTTSTAATPKPASDRTPRTHFNPRNLIDEIKAANAQGKTLGVDFVGPRSRITLQAEVYGDVHAASARWGGSGPVVLNLSR
jgi:hypothetical protein